MGHDQTGVGYVALPSGGSGPGLLVLHAWWGLNDFFKRLCDRLAAEGFVVVAPDLYNNGATVSTIDEAKQLIETRDFEATQRNVLGAVDFLRSREQQPGRRFGAIGFSMGGAWALYLSTLRPDDIAAVVVFYGSGDADFTQARATYLGHYAEVDEWEPLEGVRQMEADIRAAGREVTFNFYTGVSHWFFEDDRPEYDAHAGQLAWQRTLEFLRAHLA